MKKNYYILVVLSIFLSACHNTIKKDTTLLSSTLTCKEDEMLICTKKEAKAGVSIVRLEGRDIPDFILESGSDLEKIFNLNIKYLNSPSAKNISYNFAGKKITQDVLLKSTLALKDILKTSKNDEELNRRIREKFDVYELKNGTNPVVFSSYYEPIFEASITKDNIYRYPLYRRPDDLIDINLESFDTERYKGQKLTGRLDSNRLIPYYSREEIDFDGILSGKGYEIAYMKDIADLLDIHTQGSGVLKMRDGSYKRARFAATNSLKFKGWMTALLESGYIKRDGGVGDDKTFYDRSKKFINEHPELHRKIIGQNKRYVFFSIADLKLLDEGPIGTYGLNLVAQRSVAVDNSIIPMGTPAVINVKLPLVDDSFNISSFNNSKKIVFCQDTGGAINGARVDFFAGTGEKAKKFAYSVWEKGNFYLLIIK